MIRTLGRVLQHDPRSRDYVSEQATKLQTVTHRHYGPPLDQTPWGACTGNALAQLLNTAPFHIPYHRYLKEADALRIYGRATEIDSFPGVFNASNPYAPNSRDTGSSGLAVAKAGVEFGYFNSYTHAFGIGQALATAVVTPFITGTDWMSDMDHPDEKGFVTPTGTLRGGHEYLGFGINVEEEYLLFLNSWGRWGWRGTGVFKMRFPDYNTLLERQGDVTVPVK